jgi:hypothetical protein
MTMSAVPTPDADEHKGAVEQDSRDQESNTTLNGQMQHRNPSPLANDLDTDFPEPGGSPEHTGQEGGEPTKHEPVHPAAEHPDQDSGQRQKHNQGDKKDDPLAA